MGMDRHIASETRRRAQLRMNVLQAYFRAIERDGVPATQEAIASECDVSIHAVGRVLRWAESRGLPVLADSRRGKHADATSESVRASLDTMRRNSQRLSDT